MLLAAWTGARWGELIALTRDCVDLVSGPDADRSAVRPAQADGDQPARVVLQSPKTDAGRRAVHVPPHLLPVLAAHLLEQVPPGCELVFPNDHGEPLHRGSFTTVWHRARQRAGLPGFHFHDLRHTGNTLAATTGASTRELMARMGHASLSPRSAEIRRADLMALYYHRPERSVAAIEHIEKGDGPEVAAALTAWAAEARLDGDGSRP